MWCKFKMMKLTGSCMVAAVMLATGTGCSSQRAGDFTALSTKNVYAKGVDLTKLPRVENVEGEDVRLFGMGATVEDAVDHALEKGHGNLLIDAVLYSEDRVVFSGWRVKGTVVNVPYTPPVKGTATADAR